MRLVRRVLVLVIGEQETDGLVSIFFFTRDEVMSRLMVCSRDDTKS